MSARHGITDALEGLTRRVQLGARAYAGAAAAARRDDVRSHLQRFAEELRLHATALSQEIVAKGGSAPPARTTSSPRAMIVSDDLQLVLDAHEIAIDLHKMLRAVLEAGWQGQGAQSAVQRCTATVLAHRSWLLTMRIRLQPEIYATDPRGPSSARLNAQPSGDAAGSTGARRRSSE